MGTSRRQFLSRALYAGAGATVVAPFSRINPAAAAAPAAGPFTDRPDPNFLIGKVVDIADDGTISFLDLDEQVRQAKALAKTLVWKSGEFQSAPLAINDCVMGRGELDASGTLLIDRVWANILNIRGTLDGTLGANKKARVIGDDNSTWDLSARPQTIVRDRQGSERAGDFTRVRPREPVFVIAYRDLTTGAVIPHRIESALPPVGASKVSPEPVAAPNGTVTAAFAVARRGNASYFCCGSPSGCGRCGGAPSGYCSGCRSDFHQIAWPQVSSCTASCNGCCLESGYPRYGCNTQFQVANPCSGRETTVAIKDCGPNPRCRSTGCMSYDSVRFDLTPCAFSALGGSFDIGHMNLHVSAPL